MEGGNENGSKVQVWKPRNRESLYKPEEEMICVRCGRVQENTEHLLKGHHEGRMST